jgi:hypothetical protein
MKRRKRKNSLAGILAAIIVVAGAVSRLPQAKTLMKNPGAGNINVS